ncbi:RNA-binding protein NOB1 [Rhypophila decipiens]|uniref:20S-pre-rRNA D-site endonuclease NOB1 n=1 Tax=Rhypophila decipiens TaxID=261697 RepID=A0AAN6YJW2_9PEZI|nr:RNA-binding protein NOB1 [Rhypophila decipiens]
MLSLGLLSPQSRRSGRIFFDPAVIMETPIVEPKAVPPTENQNPAPTNADAVNTNTGTSATTNSTEPPVPNTPAKPVHSLVLDANAIIQNDPTVSTLLAQAEELYTIPAVISEIRDEATRSRLQTTLQPFLKIRTPRPESVQFITSFARRTGDLQVLSKPDIHLLALTYDLEVERNGGDWRLRKEPNQQRVNGKPPGREAEEGNDQISKDGETSSSADISSKGKENVDNTSQTETVEGSVSEKLNELDIKDDQEAQEAFPAEDDVEEEEDGEDSDGGGEWITPSNLKKHLAREAGHSAPLQKTQRVLQAALITADMAMRNVALRINLNLLDSRLGRVTFLKTWVLRCHGCWKVCKDTSKQFCPSCGHATLTRVSCSTDSQGNFKLHLKKNFQYNNRGNVFSIPKPTHGSASGKNSNVKGGGKKGWGQELILAEDQKEYSRKMEEEKRTRYRDLMDDDYLPSILSGARSQGNGRIKVGAGRNVNAKKRK